MCFTTLQALEAIENSWGEAYVKSTGGGGFGPVGSIAECFKELNLS
jgi:hypothetical protein